MFRFSLAERTGLAVRAQLTAVAGATMIGSGILAGLATPAFAYSPPSAAIVVDVNAGRVLHADQADAVRHPASITKVMTLFLVFERLRWGMIDLDTPLAVSARAAAEPPSKLGLKAGTTITVEEAIKALVTRSANDAATVIAENIGGSVEGFAAAMTRKARAIGMDSTVFLNAHGLPNPGQVTTARDLAVLAVAIQDRFPEEYRYFQTRSFDFAGKTHGNHNRLLGRVTGVDGIKTGFIRSSGFNLMTNAKADGRHIVTIVLGGRTGAQRDQTVTSLVQRYLPKAAGGERVTPSTGFSRAAAYALFVGDGVLPPVRPSGLGVAVAAARPASEPVIAMLHADGAPEKEEALVVENPFEVFVRDLAAVSSPDPELAEGSVTTEPEMQPQVTAFAATEDDKGGATLEAAPDRSELADLDAIAAAVKVSPARIDGLAARKGQEQMETQVPPEAVSRAVLPEAIDVPLPQPRPEIAAAVARESAPATRAAKPVKKAAIAPRKTGSTTPHAIQIAAADSERAARELLERARTKVGSPLASAEPFVERHVSGKATYFRARFGGFSAERDARSACRAVEKAGFACFHLKVQETAMAAS